MPVWIIGAGACQSVRQSIEEKKGWTFRSEGFGRDDGSRFYRI